MKPLQVIKYSDGILATAAKNVKTYRTLTVHELLTHVNSIVKNPEPNRTTRHHWRYRY
jgi:hypothetical protein